MRMLKPLRVAVSVLFFSALSIIFIDCYRLIPSWIREVSTYLQIIPSLLTSAVKFSAAGTGFIVVLILTVLFGRIYCSFICPLGFSQDIFIRAGRRFRRDKNFSYKSPHYFFFYSLLAVTVISFFISGTALLLWLDPFSIFGRFMTYSVSLPVIGINNIIASVLIKKNIFSVNSFSITPSSAGVIFSLSVFSIVMILSFFKGRLYCNLICPAGGLLSIISGFSLFRLRLDASTCIKCGMCEKTCKSSCIDHRNFHLDNSRCVSCFNCVSRCPNNSIRYSIPGLNRKKKTDDCKDIPPRPGNGMITRMSFISGMMFIPASLLSEQNRNITLYYQEPGKQKKYKKKYFSSPPGSLSIEDFNRKCTACSLCISACPTSVLQPAVLQYGIKGIMQPFMDFSTGFCNYDCTVCGDICPADAIKKFPLPDKRLIQTGKSTFIIENCITYTNGTDCGACSEHCPTKAVRMVPFRNNLVIPEVNNAICTGCGACEYACPVRPLKAIYVDGNPVHLPAGSPEIREKRVIKNDGFPF